MNKLAVLLLSIVLGGCVTIPDSAEELVRKSKTIETFCYSDEPSQVESRVSNYLASCYHPVEGTTMFSAGSIYISAPLDMEVFVIQENIPGGKRFSVRVSQGYAFSVDVIGPTDECNTNLNLYAITGFWNKAIIQTDLAARGFEAECTF